MQTSCSTSLVAVHLACRSLLAGECDMALAGGVSITVPQTSGYLYDEGSIALAGRPRAAPSTPRRSGIVIGNGVGVVVLKPLARALADGDRDPRRHPRLGDQQRRRAQGGLSRAERRGAGGGDAARRCATPASTRDSIGYVEAHGTGTPLGDPIEIAAADPRLPRLAPSGTGFCADRLGEDQFRPSRRARPASPA